MPVDGEHARWICGRAGVVSLQRVSAIVKEFREPYLHLSPAKGSKMLKPEKWQTVFDSNGNVLGFRKALKLIVLGGVDPSIRAEVWEFLLGCYGLSSSKEYRMQLRVARRERYEDLIKQCQLMHSSIGTGSLAYVVGSKVMDARTSSKNDVTEALNEMPESMRGSPDTTNELEGFSDMNDFCKDLSFTHQIECPSNSDELVTMRGTKSASYDSSFSQHSRSRNYFSTNYESEIHQSENVTESFYFPTLPVTNLFRIHGRSDSESKIHDGRVSVSANPLRFRDKNMHSFQISNNVDLIMETSTPSNDLLHEFDSETETTRLKDLTHGTRSKKLAYKTKKVNRPKMLDASEADIEDATTSSTYASDEARVHGTRSKKLVYKTKKVNRPKILDAPEADIEDTTTSSTYVADEARVSEWLWTLHRIVVDVVRTDSHLEFYEDSKNKARMSDILAVYAWIDPSTGYCQGMSDLLSPFVVIYEDNADAFWCFEMLLRRMRENFQMDGPTGVLKQLQALWKILELTDAEMFEHLSVIGAESLHFAFRMLLVLFRRELPFDEAVCMWEMMWAADFDEAVVGQLEDNCLEPLVIQLHRSLSLEKRTENTENGKKRSKRLRSHSRNANIGAFYSNWRKTASCHPLCGLTSANLRRRNHQQQQQASTTTATRNGDGELAVFIVAAILVTNRQKIFRKTHSFEDVIKIFNDNVLKINVKRCIRTAIKLRNKYFYKLTKQASPESPEEP